VIIARESCQANSTRSRPAISEPPDPRDIFTSWIPSTGSDDAVETLDRLPGLARAIEVWERDLPAGEPDTEHEQDALFRIASSSSLDALHPDESRWLGPDPLDDWEQERID
jgi:hypothetical protein